MSEINTTSKITNSKVDLSKEVLKYLNSWRTNENSKYIDDYIKILCEKSNINSTKFDEHHVIPCFYFKDEEHKTRQETEKLANKINGNKIKLSYKNHIMAHYFLWKIFPNNKNARTPIHLMIKKLNINNLTEIEIKEFASIQEECRKANLTEEEKKKIACEYSKNYYNIHHKNNPQFKQIKREYDKDRMSSDEYKEAKREYDKNYRLLNADKRRETAKIYSQTHKREKQEYDKNLHKQVCLDPITNTYCTYKQLSHKKYDNSDVKILYKDVNLKSCIITDENIIKQFYKEKEEKEKLEKLLNSLPKICLDPIKGDFCYMSTFEYRISNNKDLYKNIKASKYKLTNVDKIIELDNLLKSKHKTKKRL